MPRKPRRPPDVLSNIPNPHVIVQKQPLAQRNCLQKIQTRAHKRGLKPQILREKSGNFSPGKSHFGADWGLSRPHFRADRDQFLRTSQPRGKSRNCPERALFGPLVPSPRLLSPCLDLPDCLNRNLNRFRLLSFAVQVPTLPFGENPKSAPFGPPPLFYRAPPRWFQLPGERRGRWLHNSRQTYYRLEVAKPWLEGAHFRFGGWDCLGGAL